MCVPIKVQPELILSYSSLVWLNKILSYGQILYFFSPIFAQSTLRQEKEFTEFTEILKNPNLIPVKIPIFKNPNNIYSYLTVKLILHSSI